MVSEGQLSWSLKPWVRRLFTRSIAITPSIIIAASVGSDGLSTALEATQVALSVILPVVSAPLLYFTCRAKYMTVSVDGDENIQTATAAENVSDTPTQNPSRQESGPGTRREVQMRNHWITTAFALLIWGVIVVMNIAALVLLGKGVE